MVASRVRVARRYLISGRVQGVGFRYFASAAAEREHVAGWVQNLPDRRVEVEAEADPAALDRFEQALRTGPPGARIDAMDVTELSARAHSSEFRIR
jgi:acylphosphatase